MCLGVHPPFHTDLFQLGLAYLYVYCKGNDTVCLQERARAAALGYTDPTNPSFEATTEMYNRTLTECLRRIKDLKDRNEDARKIAIMVASHNENTVRFAIEKYAVSMSVC
jgi:hypothetical protein